MVMMWKSKGAVPLHRGKAAEDTGNSTDESLPVLSLRASVRADPINTGSPKALTSHPLGWELEMASEIGGRRKRGVETRRRIPLPEFMLLLLVRSFPTLSECG